MGGIPRAARHWDAEEKNPRTARMTPIDFPEANRTFGPPKGYTEEQIRSIAAFQGVVLGGSLDGCEVVVVAWRPDDKDLERLNNGGVVYLQVLGGLPPHLLGTDFNEVVTPA